MLLVMPTTPSTHCSSHGRVACCTCVHADMLQSTMADLLKRLASCLQPDWVFDLGPFGCLKPGLHWIAAVRAGGRAENLVLVAVCSPFSSNLLFDVTALWLAL